MVILSIETSCDETAISLVEASGKLNNAKFKILGNALYSQVKIHAKYGGVYPNLAKREHQKNLIPLLHKTLKEAGFLTHLRAKNLSSKKTNGKASSVEKNLEREPELLKQFAKFIPKITRPPIDLIAVTKGPGLEPALWVGINFAKALSNIWGIPVIGINHMEGHILSVLLIEKGSRLLPVKYPALSLLISGGHTQLIFSKSPLKYRLIGETRDDAVGESYDKVARMLHLPYPGGLTIDRLASEERGISPKPDPNFKFPRPMINSNDFDFSFSGLKTSVLYKLQKMGKLNNNKKRKVARAFEDAVIDTLMTKTSKAIDKFKPKTLIVAGGVIASETLRAKFRELTDKFANLSFRIPERRLSTDNSVMIALVAYVNVVGKRGPLKSDRDIVANGSLSLKNKSV